MNGCLSITLRRIGGCEASAERKGGLSGVAKKVNGCLRFSFGLVCMTSIGGAPSGYEVLWASDGILFTIDNGYLYVRK